MSMTTVTCMPTSNPTDKLMVTGKMPFAPNTMTIWIETKLKSMINSMKMTKMTMMTKMVKMAEMAKMLTTLMTMTKACTEHSSNDGYKSELCDPLQLHKAVSASLVIPDKN